MKVLVTGGAGFIGSHVVDLLIDNGYEVVIVDDLSTGRKSNLNPAATFYPMDIRSPELAGVFEKERPDYVDHHAAQMNVHRSVIDPLFDADVNVRGSINLLENARNYGVKHFIYISTGGAVYGEPIYLPCDENHPINPICPYGASKHSVEHYLYMYHLNYGLSYTVLRYPNVYGPRQDPQGEAGVIAIFIAQMLKNEPVMINGDGENERDFVYVSDCAQANLLSIQCANGAGIYNIGSSQGVTINQVYAALKQRTGYLLEAVHGPARVGETRRIYLDATKAAQGLKWKPKVSFDEGLSLTVDYFREKEIIR